MTDVNYSDYYKFLASIGIIFVTLGFISPWVVASSDIINLVNSTAISNQSPEVQRIVINQISMLNFFFEYIKIISIVFIVLGSVLLVLSSYFWIPKQRIQDKKEVLELRNIEKAIRPSDSIEIHEQIKIDEEEQLIGIGGGGGITNPTDEEMELMIRDHKNRNIAIIQERENQVIDTFLSESSSYYVKRYINIENNFFDFYLEPINSSESLIFANIKIILGYEELNRLESVLINFDKSISELKQKFWGNTKFCILFLLEDNSQFNEIFPYLFDYQKIYKNFNILVMQYEDFLKLPISLKIHKIANKDNYEPLG